MSIDKEKQYLSKIIQAHDYNPDIFLINLENGKVIEGFSLSLNGNDINFKNPIIKLYAIRAFYPTIVDLSDKIKYSLLQALQFAYKCDVSQGWSPFKEKSKNEFLATLYLEYASLRLSTLWDMLGHLYNVNYNMPWKHIENIHYKNVFNPKGLRKEFKKDPYINEICKYLGEEDNTNIETEYGMWKGNHNYIKKFRDQLAHRNSPTLSTLISIVNKEEDQDTFFIQSPPCFILKRIAEDFYKANSFIKKTLGTCSQTIGKLIK